MLLLRSYLCLFIALAMTINVVAQTPDAKDKPVEAPRVVKLSLTPAAEPRPALQYQLLPPGMTRQPGNAAPYYYRAIMQAMSQRGQPVQKDFEKCQQLWKNSLREVPVEDIRKCVAGYKGTFDQLQIATHREYCDWEWRIEDLRGEAVYSFLLPELQETRSMGRLLAMKAYLHLLDGQQQEAFEALQMGYQLAHDAAQQPLLINTLVSVAITNTLNDILVEIIQRPASPNNVYWAIAALPNPVVDLRPAMVNEMTSYERVFPLLKDPEHAIHSPDEWRQLVMQQFLKLHSLVENKDAKPAAESTEDSREFHDKLREAFPIAVANAKKELLSHGFDSAKLEKMSDGQVLAIQSSRALRYSSDEILKHHLNAGPEVLNRLHEVEERLKQEGYLSPPLQGKEPFGIGAMLYPALARVSATTQKLQRNLAALQTIEALRMHAAQQAGKLPSSLDEIKVVPVPLNPATGKPFPYKLAENKAILEVPHVLQSSDGIIYEIEMEAAK